MSYLSIYRSSTDDSLRYRITSCTVQEAWNNPTFAESDYAKTVKYESQNATRMIWPVCISPDVEAAYAYALDAGNPNPGGDPGVVTDGMIIANIQGKWPFDYVSPQNEPHF